MKAQFQISPDVSSVVVILILILLYFFISLRSRHEFFPKKNLSLLLANFASFFAFLMLAILILKPEIFTFIKNEKVPNLAILCDISKSMYTIDVSEEERFISRKEWLENFTESERIKELKKKFNLLQITFPEETTDGSGTNIASALESLKDKTFKHIILLSDGLHTAENSPVESAAKLALNGSKVHSICVGSEKFMPDLILSGVRSPSFCMLGEQITIPFQIENKFESQIKTSITFKAGNYPPELKEFNLNAGETLKNEFKWKAVEKGKIKISISLDKVKGEVNQENNTFSTEIDVKEDKIKVLLADSLPRWEFRYIKNALSRDPGVSPQFILYHPKIKMPEGNNYVLKFPDKNEIRSIDVIFLGDLGTKELSEEDLKNIQINVEQNAAGLVLLPGRKGKLLELENSSISDLFPIISDQSNPSGLQGKIEASLELTRYGQDHHLTMLEDSVVANKILWKNLPGFTWCWSVLKASPDAKIIATHPYLQNKNGKIPLLVEKNYGSGLVLFMGIDHVWKWRKAVEDKYHYRFWSQVIRWMAHKRFLGKSSGARIFYEPETPSIGENVSVKVILSDKIIVGKEDKLLLSVKNKERGNIESYILKNTTENPNLFLTEITIKNSGTQIFTASTEKNTQIASAEIIVKSEKPEKLWQPADTELMKSIARAGNGSFAKCNDSEKIIELLKHEPEEKFIRKLFPLWSNIWVISSIIALLSISWILKKIAGRI